MAGIYTKQQDYQYALEGISYIQIILRNAGKDIADIVQELNHPEVMGGETGREYCKRLNEAVTVVDACIERFNAFATKVAEVCRANGAFVDQTVLEDFDKVQKLFATKADEIKSFKGQKKA